MLFRGGVILAFILGTAIFAYQIGSRLTDEAVMTLVGVLCGIVATIPITIGLVIALTRHRAHYDADEYLEPYPEDPAPSAYPVYRPPMPTAPPQQQPQIIVVAPPQTPYLAPYAPYSNYLLPAHSSAPMEERNFKIVGEDEGD
ncbi:MAG TPA: hypothetical protein VFD70_09255 [Anaerolineae bacterium]|nr:hypothetical protein [Anaerolineae bacterium]